MEREQLIDRLSQAEVATREELERALEAHQSDELPDADRLVQAGFPEWPIYEILAQEHRIPLVHIDPEGLSPRVVSLIAREVAEHYAVIPLEVQDTRLVLAMADPVDVIAEDVVRFATQLEVQRVMAPRSEILAALAQSHAQESTVGSILERIPDTELEFSREEEDSGEAALDEEHRSRPVIALVNRILSDAIKMSASDIHVEPGERILRVRYRIDGVLRTVVELPRKVQSACLSRLKLMGGMDIAERRVPQDGRFRVSLKDRDVDLRVSSLPGSRGEKVVMRVLDRRAGTLKVEQLGLQGLAQERFEQALASPQGMILITGPTGSGKTTTLYAALGWLNREQVNLITVEDPIEYELPGIHQVPIQVKAGLTFARSLRSILRQDPDVVMVGEIRDPETAEVALQAAQTGHLVLSTLHTNDSSQCVTRLLHMGVPPYLVGGALLCVVAQRLVRHLCPGCRVATPVPSSARNLLGPAERSLLPADTFRSTGCEECHLTGFRGRLGLYEVMPVTDRLRGLILQNAPALALERAAREEGMTSLLEDGLRKVAEGLTSLDEVLRVVQVRVEGQRVCMACEQPLQEDFTYCPYCTEGITQFCPACSKGLRPEWAACPYCGCALSKPERSRATPSETVPPPPPPPPSPPTETPDVLIVVAEPTLRTVLRRLLERVGHEVVSAESQEQATTVARTRLPRLLVADLACLSQPTEFVRSLRENLGTSLTPLLLLTCRGSEGTLEGLALQADDYLLKPVEPEPLVAKVARLLRRTRA